MCATRPVNPLILDIIHLLRRAKCELAFWVTTTRHSCQKILNLGFLELMGYMDVVPKKSVILVYLM